MNYIVQKLGETYPIYESITGVKDRELKICSFRNGEIDFLEIIKQGLKKEKAEVLFG